MKDIFREILNQVSVKDFLIFLSYVILLLSGVTGAIWLCS